MKQERKPVRENSIAIVVVVVAIVAARRWPKKSKLKNESIGVGIFRLHSEAAKSRRWMA